MAAEEDPSTTDYGNSTEDDRTLMSSHQIKMEVEDEIVPVDSKAEQITDEVLRKIKIEEDLLIKEEIGVKEEKFDVKAVKQEIPEVDHKLSARVTVDLVPIKRGELNIKVEKNKNEPQVYPDPGEEVEESILPEPSRSETPQENSVKKFKRVAPASPPQRVSEGGPGTETGKNRKKSYEEVTAIMKLAGNYVFYCNLCNKIFHVENSFKIHKETKCGTVKIFLDCEFCGKSFQKAYYLKHVNNVHKRSPLSELTCDLCQKVYPHQDALKEHVHKLHNLKRFECSYCTKLFKIKAQLKYHIHKWHMSAIDLHSSTGESSRKSESKKNPEIMCEVCGKVLSSNSALKSHRRTHTGDKPFVCDACGKSFRTESNLHQHSRAHSEERRFSCDLCDKSFRIKHHLRQHMAVHGMADTSLKRKKVK